MAAESKSPGLKIEPEALTLEWLGCQYYKRAKGTKEILTRSFPFWHTDMNYVVEYARQTNKLKKDDERKTNWTHVKVHTRLVETKEGAQIAIFKELNEEYQL